MLRAIAAPGGFLVPLNWPALTPAPTEIRLFALERRSALAGHRLWSGCEISGLTALLLFSPRRQARFLLRQQTLGILKPNVRAKRATTAGRQARAGENVPRTTRPGLVACRWRSA